MSVDAISRTTQVSNPVNTSNKSVSNNNKLLNAIDFNKDGDVKLEGSLIALSVVGLAALGMAIKGKGDKAISKGNEIAQEATSKGQAAVEKAASNGNETVQEILQETLENAVQRNQSTIQGAESAASKSVSEGLTPKIDYEERASQQLHDSAVDYHLGLSSYSKAKKSATQNLPRENKKQVREALRETFVQKRTLENSQRKQAQQINSVISTANANQNIASNNITSKTNDGLLEQVKIHADAADRANKTADYADILYEQNPTKRNRKFAYRARQNAQRIEARKNREVQKAINKSADIAEQDNKKLQGALEIMENTSFEKRQEGHLKALNNGDKALENAVKRDDKNLLNNARTQRAVRKLRWLSREKIESIAQSSNDKFEKRAAQALLNAEV